jgi:prepilin-type N-terminal cleavage/methylation domain-containing protein
MIAAVERPAGSLAASAEAGRGSARAPRAAFTLLEILISLALIALLVGATVSISDNLIGKPPTTDEVFWKALNQARKQALTSQQDMQMGFDSKTKAFVIGTNVGAQTDANASGQASANAGTQTGANASEQTSSDAGAQAFPVPLADKLTVDFLPAGKSNSSVLIGGDLLETQTMPFVTFYSDGTCTPFRVQFHSIGAARIVAVDPWTCAAVLEEKK